LKYLKQYQRQEDFEDECGHEHGQKNSGNEA
jgi:hypothetical protein